MKKVFTHENRLIVFNIKNLLQGQDIDCHIKNEYSSGGVGDLSPFETWPEVWVADKNIAQAEQVINLHLKTETEGPEWRCVDCGEQNVGSFEICWNCSHEKSS